MSRNYDNWERLVAAVIKRQQIWELCHQHSRTISSCSEASSISDFGSSSTESAQNSVTGEVSMICYKHDLNSPANRSPIRLEMSTSKLHVEPLELQFPFELKKQVSCFLKLSNKSDNYVAFKFKTTNPENYCVRPNTGVLLPRSTCDVITYMQAQKQAPADMQCWDKFLIQSVAVSPGSTRGDINDEMFSKELGNHVEECKLRVSYVPTQVEGLNSPADRSANYLEMSTGDLHIEPLELRFLFELKRHASCSLQLSNKSDNYVAFKVKTTNPKKYNVRLHTGVLLPRSTCDVIVTMQALKKVPADMHCRDKFLIQCVALSPGYTAKDVTAEMFSKLLGNHVEEYKLRVSYVPAPQHDFDTMKRLPSLSGPVLL